MPPVYRLALPALCLSLILPCAFSVEAADPAPDAALPLAAMLAFARGPGVRIGSLASAAAGACGALAGQGVLLTSCAADESVMHVLVFHFLGVLLATAGGAVLGAATGSFRSAAQR